MSDRGLTDGLASVEIARRVETATREVKPWVEPAARIGHAAKGLVFVLTGVLTAATQLAMGGEVDGPEAAFAALRRAPLGKVVLATIGIGLLYYAAWELCRALTDPERQARGKLLPRLEWLVGAVIFGFLSVGAFRVAFGRAAARGDETARSWAAGVMANIPLGGMVLGLVGVLVIVGGAVLIRRGWRAEFERAIDLHAVSPRSGAAILALASLGIVARGAIVFIIGVFLAVAGWRHDPHEAVGIEGALRMLGRQPFGLSLMAGAALGLAGYGIYELLIAWKGRFYID
jgi:hypothetical protein